MKKFTFLILLTFCIAQVNAQVGVRVGFNLPNVSTDIEGFEASSSTGFQAGLTYQAALTDKVAIRPGILYSIKGYKIDILGFEGSAAFNYIEIPIDLVFGVYDAEAFGIDLHAGPYFGYMLSGSEDFGGTTEDIDFDDPDSPSRSDFGLNVGTTVNFSGIYVGLNYGLGFTNLNTDDTFDASIKNTNLSIIAGYMFGAVSNDE